MGGGGLKQPRREAEHSPESSAEVKNLWIYTLAPPYFFVVSCLLSTGANLPLPQVVLWHLLTNANLLKEMQS
jgi:hypothetical protein